MDRRALELEALRQRVQATEQAQGERADYLDRARLDEDQQAQIVQEMAEFGRLAEAERARFGARLASLRASAPQVVAEWVGWHAALCLRILAEGPGAPGENGFVTNQQIRQHVAAETLENWQKVLVGAQDYVSINDYFLGDYDAEVRRAVEG